MDKIQAMSTFVAVVEAGSFVKAMSVLGISKAAVSRHVAELEQHLETRLLQRTTRRLSLTTEGQRYSANGGATGLTWACPRPCAACCNSSKPEQTAKGAISLLY